MTPPTSPDSPFYVEIEAKRWRGGLDACWRASVGQQCLFCHSPEIEKSYLLAASHLDRHWKASGLSELLSPLPEGARPLLFAGVVRDALYTALTDKEVVPRDYDIGIAQISREDFDRFASILHGRLNRYGGYQLRTEGDQIVDVWRLEDTIGFRDGSYAPSIRNVLRTFVIDVNAAAYDPLRRVLYDQGALQALMRRRIGIVRSPLLHDHSDFAGRALALRERLRLSLTASLRAFVRTWYTREETRRHLDKTRLTLDTQDDTVESPRPESLVSR